MSNTELVVNFQTGIPGKCPIVRYEVGYNTINSDLPIAFQDGEDIFIGSELPSDLFEYEFSAVQVTGLTDELKSATFYVVPTIGCFFETTIQKVLEPYSEDFDFAIALPLSIPDDPSTFLFT